MSIIAIKFTLEPPSEIPEIKTKDKHCHFIGKVRKGKDFYVSADNISCPLARFYLGIGKTNLKDLSETLVGWGDAVDGKTGLKYLDSALCIKQEIKYITYFVYPHSKLKPDIIIKIDNPGNIQALIQRFSSLTGERIRVSLSGIGAACGECTAYPYVSKRINVSVGCNGSRPGVGLEQDELLLAAPFDSKMVNILIGEG